ncbi:xanthine dehydrogenase family protein subunit M [Burkholderia sp. Bp9142]|uniref:FAD binding domain-containing protein n=1 Tax=Burkholderia sp. Bp9142 TaxID=2184573 RepID=UPI000F5A124D|nr:xanthine dehydrogenase family protein subunit M [Burkholderia sp. Bp9142]RQR24587.1 xanthine dehydrogenase family protein subunit M [Burkholderia sp. Bp9142]
MYPAPFDYHRPADIAEALELLDKYGEDARILAGGFSLIPAMKLRMAQPAHLVDIGGIEILKGIRIEGDVLSVGAMTTHWEIESSPLVAEWFPGLCRAAGAIADAQVRNRGTIGGSLSYSDPNADYPAHILALDAQLVTIGLEGGKIIDATDWQQDLLTTVMEHGDILIDVRFPKPAPLNGSAYIKVPHPASRFAVVGVAASLNLDESGKARNVRIGVTGASTVAKRAQVMERELEGTVLTRKTIETACKQASEGIEFSDDMLLSAEDRAQLCRVTACQAVLAAWSQALKQETLL